MKKITLKISAEEFKKKLKIKDGKDGQAPIIDYAKIEASVLKKLPKVKNGIDGKDAKFDESKLFKKLLKELLKHIPEQDTMNQIGYTSGGANPLIIQDEGVKLNPHVTTLNFIGDAVAATYAGNGVINVSIAGSSGTPVDNEIPTGTIDNANVTFTLTQSPSPAGSLRLYLQGQLQILSVDYTLSGNTITFINAPMKPEEGTAYLRAWYRF